MTSKYTVTALAWVEFDPSVRKQPPGERYASLASFDGERPQWTLVAEFPVPLEEESWSGLAEVDFLVDEAPHDLLVGGAEFVWHEGPRAVAKGRLLTASQRVNASRVRDGAGSSAEPRYTQEAA